MFLCVLLMAVGAPRFNRQDWFGIGRISSAGQGTLGDAEYYLNHIRFFRNEGGPELLTPPFAYRPLPIALAAPLPFSPMTSLNVINGISMLGALFFLLRMLGQIKISAGGCFLGGLAFIVSFPTFYYSTVGYVDPVLIVALCAAMYLIARREQEVPLFVLSVVSAGINEKYVIIFPVWLLHLVWIEKKNLLRSAGVVGASLVLFIVSIEVIRHVTPTGHYGWYFNLQAAIGNAVRPRTWLSFLLTWGPLGLVVCYYLFKNIRTTLRDPQISILWVGVAAGLSVWAYGFISVYTDGRYAWLCYPFMVPLFCIYFERYSPAFAALRERLNRLVEK